MRRMLRILFWLGLGLSTILFVGTGVLWVRSLGHREFWRFERFEPRTVWKSGYHPAWGALRDGYIALLHGRLIVAMSISEPAVKQRPQTDYQREPISAEMAGQHFESSFAPGQRQWGNGTERVWRVAGAAFRHRRWPVDAQTGRPSEEAFALAIPFWLLAVVFGLWPVCFAARRVFRRRRYGAGLCPQCGYDLRATPERCPECGRAVDAARGLGENG